jgi:phosphoribosylamine-glycine ligase
MEGGKGAKPYTRDELVKALTEVDDVADKGDDLIIQGRLTGPEYSLILMLDGNGGAVATTLSRDHKALLDGGEGPNTGGMGSFAPLNLAQASLSRRREMERIGLQIVDGLVEEAIDYKGAVYAGLMAETQDPQSALKLLEINVRLGDPETQVILQSLGGKAIEYMYACARGQCDSDMGRLYLDASRNLVSLTVCLASPGYPEGPVVTGLRIHVPQELPDDISIQFAGAKIINDNPVSNGGRVAYITKTAKNIHDARRVYDYIGLENSGLAIGNDEQVTRSDIGLI